MLTDRVPMFKLKPNGGLLVSALLVLVIGGLLSAYLMNEDSYNGGANRGIFSWIVTGLITICLVIAATARLWFKHLWHHRPGYKRG